MEKFMVEYNGNGKFDLILPKPMKAGASLLVLIGTHKIEMLLDEAKGKFWGVRGTRQNLLDWLKSIGINAEAIQQFADAMNEEN